MTKQRSSTFGDLLRRYRHAAGLTQEELAARAGLGVRTISNLERGVNKAPYQDTVRRLAEALGLSDKARTSFSGSARSPGKEELSGREATRPEIRGAFLGAIPQERLVARERELAVALGALEAVANGMGRTVLLLGEPGIGKTRLAQEVSVHAWEKGFLVAAGRCYEAQSGVPFYPFLEALSVLYEDAPPEVREGMPERWPYLTRLLPDHFPLRSASPSEGQEESQLLLRAVAGFAREVSAVVPVAFLLDDLHWADGASLELLAHLSRHTRGERVLVLGTYREVGAGHPVRRVVQELRREQLVEEVTVRNLRRDETSALVSDRLDGARVSEEFAGLMYGHTRGNPFFTVEALRALIERGDLTRWEGRWVRRDIEAIEVPESVSEAINERASRLRPEAREALEEASVFGLAFAFEDLRAASGRGEQEMEEVLEEALSTGLLQTENDRYAFNHPLTQQTLYAQLSPARRKRLHRAAGRTLERLEERILERRAAEVARHFSKGGEPGRALPYALLAGAGSEAVFALGEAEVCYREALRLAEETGDRSAEVEAIKRLGVVLTLAARCDEALEVLERASELAVERGDRENEVQVLARIGLAYFYKGGAEGEFIARLQRLAEEFDSPVSSGVRLESLATLWRALAALLFTAHRYRESLEAARRTLSLAREAGDDDRVVRAEIACAKALIFLRRPVEAREALEAAMSLAEQTDATLNILFGTLMLELLDTARGAFERSLEWTARGLALAGQLDNRHEVSFRTARGGLIRFYRGEWNEAREQLERAVKLGRSIEPMFLSAWAPSYLGALRMAEGNWEAASLCLEEAQDFAQRIHWPTSLRYTLSLRAELHVLEGRPDAAVNLLEPLAGVPDPDWLYATVLLSVLGWGYLEVGETSKAEEVSERAIEEAARMNNRVDAVGALRVRGMTLARQGREEEAEAVLEKGLSLARSMPYPYAEARVLREYGALRGHSGEPEQARERLSAALDIFRRLGARKEVEQTLHELEEI